MQKKRTVSIQLLFAIVPVLWAAAVSAEPVYKYRMPDGRIVYTSEVLRNAKLLDTLRDPTPPQPVDPGAEAKRKNTQDALQRTSNDRLAALARADVAVVEAARILDAAKARQATGVEPEEGERVGTVRAGRGRARDEYLERQAELQKAVDDARARLEEAYRTRDSLK